MCAIYPCAQYLHIGTLKSIPVGYLPKGHLPENSRMDKYELRRLRLRQLIEDKCDGRSATLAKRIGRDPSYVSRMLYAEGKAGRKRIGDDMVELIETRLEVPRGTLDGYANPASEGLSLLKGRPTAIPSSSDDIAIPQYETGGLGGNGGLVLRDQPGIIQNWSVNREWLQANVPHCTSPRNLCIVTGFGDSMPDTFNPGDPVLVDGGIKVCDHDGVYFFRIGHEGFIKRLGNPPTFSGLQKWSGWLVPVSALA